MARRRRADAVRSKSCGFARGTPGTQPCDLRRRRYEPDRVAAWATAPAEKQPELTPEEKAEKVTRKACKAKICDIIATRDPAGEDISCDITKTRREEDIAKMLGDKIEWPW